MLWELSSHTTHTDPHSSSTPPLCQISGVASFGQCPPLQGTLTLRLSDGHNLLCQIHVATSVHSASQCFTLHTHTHRQTQCTDPQEQSCTNTITQTTHTHTPTTAGFVWVLLLIEVLARTQLCPALMPKTKYAIQQCSGTERLTGSALCGPGCYSG